MSFLFWGKQDKKIMEVPAALPDTIMDKVGTTETLPGGQPNIALPPQPAQQKDNKMLPPEIASAANAKPMPVQAQVVSIHPPQNAPPQIPQQMPPGQFPTQYPGYPMQYNPYMYPYYYPQFQQGMMPIPPGQDPNMPPQQMPSFFSELEKRYPQEKGFMHDYVSSDLIGKLREYHSTTNPQQGFFMHNGDADAMVYRKLVELKELESEWLMRKREVDSAEMLLSEKESEIQAKLDDFRNSLMSADKFRLFHMKAPFGNEFLLMDGTRLTTVQELMFALLKMSDDVFKHHVTGDRNDFATWIRYVFNAERLATLIFPAKSKEEMVNLLKTF